GRVLFGRVLRLRLFHGRYDLDSRRRDEELRVTSLDDDALSETERVRHRERSRSRRGRFGLTTLIDDGAREPCRFDGQAEVRRALIDVTYDFDEQVLVRAELVRRTHFCAL